VIREDFLQQVLVPERVLHQPSGEESFQQKNGTILEADEEDQSSRQFLGADSQ
jgi:hypothetical protein